MKPSNSGRYPEIDVARGIGIILVVLGHNWLFVNNYPALKQVIYSFHVPLFFFLSGLVFKPQQHTKSLVYKRIASLLKPYFMALILYELYRLISGKSESILPFWGILYATGQSISITPLWFLPHLFVVTLFSNLMIIFFNNKLNNYSFAILIIGILMIGVFMLQFFSNPSLHSSLDFGKALDIPLGLPLSIDLMLISTAFFVSGWLYADALKLNQPDYSTLLLSVSLFMAVNLYLNPSLDMNSRIYENLVPTSIAAFAGIWATIVCSKIISQKTQWLTRILSYVGSASLFILIFHGFIQGAFAHKFNLWLPRYSYMSIVLSASIAIGISCALFYLTNKYQKLRLIIQ